MSLTEVHANLANAMLLFLVVAGLWGVGTYVLKREITGSYWGILAVGELLILAQLIVGIALLIQGARPGRDIHILYGIVAAIGLPAYYGYSKGRDDRRAALYFGLLCLFLFGISLRALDTAPKLP